MKKHIWQMVTFLVLLFLVGARAEALPITRRSPSYPGSIFEAIVKNDLGAAMRLIQTKHPTLFESLWLSPDATVTAAGYALIKNRHEIAMELVNNALAYHASPHNIAGSFREGYYNFFALALIYGDFEIAHRLLDQNIYLMYDGQGTQYYSGFDILITNTREDNYSEYSKFMLKIVHAKIAPNTNAMMDLRGAEWRMNAYYWLTKTADPLFLVFLDVISANEVINIATSKAFNRTTERIQNVAARSQITVLQKFLDRGVTLTYDMYISAACYGNLDSLKLLYNKAPLDAVGICKLINDCGFRHIENQVTDYLLQQLGSQRCQ